VLHELSSRKTLMHSIGVPCAFRQCKGSIRYRVMVALYPAGSFCSIILEILSPCFSFWHYHILSQNFPFSRFKVHSAKCLQGRCRLTQEDVEEALTLEPLRILLSRTTLFRESSLSSSIGSSDTIWWKLQYGLPPLDMAWSSKTVEM